MVMNTEKKIYVALAVLALMLGGLWLQQRSVQKEELAHSPEGSALPSISISSDDADKITKVEIANAGKSDVVLEKDGDKWKVTKPVAADASQPNVKSLIDNMKELKLKETIDKGTSQYASYDLDGDKEVHVQAFKGNDKALDVYFGKSGTRGQMTRVAGQDGVYIASGYSSYLYTRELKNWRNTEVFNFDDANVVSASLQNEHGKFSFTKNDGKWSATVDGKPIKDFDGDKVNDLVRAFKALNAEDFADGKPDSDTGLDKPVATVSFTLKDNAGNPTLKLGKTSTGSSHFASKEGAPTIFTIGSWTSDWALAAPTKFAKPEAKDGGAAIPMNPHGNPHAAMGMPMGMPAPTTAKK
jgi:hypothetical protein